MDSNAEKQGTQYQQPHELAPQELAPQPLAPQPLAPQHAASQQIAPQQPSSPPPAFTSPYVSPQWTGVSVPDGSGSPAYVSPQYTPAVPVTDGNANANGHPRDGAVQEKAGEQYIVQQQQQQEQQQIPPQGYFAPHDAKAVAPVPAQGGVQYAGQQPGQYPGQYPGYYGAVQQGSAGAGALIQPYAQQQQVPQAQLPRQDSAPQVVGGVASNTNTNGTTRGAAPDGQKQYNTVVPIMCLGQTSAPVDCPNCHKRCLTSTTRHVGNTNHAWAVVLCLTTALFCFVPYLVSGLKDVEHRCSSCGVLLATTHKSGRVDVHAHA